MSEQITGIEQKEKIPDEIVRAADQVERAGRHTPEALPGAGFSSPRQRPCS